MAQQKSTPAYLITEVEIIDQESMKTFVAKVNPLVKSHGGEYISRGGKITSLAGNTPKTVVIIRFDDSDKAVAYYKSAEYTALIPLRDKAMKYRSFYVIEGGDHPL